MRVLNGPRASCAGLGLVLVALGGCYAPAHFTECTVRCAEDRSCPSGTTCEADGYCHEAAQDCTSVITFGGVTSAVAIDETSIRVGWSEASEPNVDPAELKYLIYVGDRPGAALAGPPFATSVPGATSAQLTGFAAGTTRYVAVRALDTQNLSDANTVELAVTTLDLTAPAFAGVASLTASGTTLQAKYAAATDNVDQPNAIAYRVYLSTTPGGQDFGKPAATTDPGVTTAIVDGLVSSAAYYVVVRAVDRAGNEDDNTVELSVGFGDTNPPSFTGADTATGLPNAVKLTWTAATDLVSPQSKLVYLVYQATAPGGEAFGAPTAMSAPGATTVSVGGLTKSTPYWFVVRARDEAGNVDTNVKEVTATTAASDDTTAPVFAGLASATSSGPSSITLSWAAATDDISPSGEIVYLVYLAEAPGMENFATPSFVTAPGATTFEVGGLMAAKAYSFVVRARDQAGRIGLNAVERTATTDSDNTPPAFAGVASGMAISSTRISLSWAPASDGVSPAARIDYLAYCSKVLGGQSFAAPTVPAVRGVSSVQIPGLDPSTDYYCVVRARDEAGNTDTNTVQQKVTTLADVVAPTFAGATSAAAQSNSSIKITWSPGSDDVTPAAQLVYDVYRASKANGEAFGTPTYTSAPGATSFTATGLAAITTYYFVVRARDAAGNHDANQVEVSATTPLLF